MRFISVMLSAKVNSELFFRAPGICYYFFAMAVLKTIHYAHIHSPVGKLLLAAGESGLRCLHFDDGTMPAPRRNEVWTCAPEKLQPYEEQVHAYFRGELQKFTFPLDLAGTAFQKKCWKALLRIPYGQTCSYADI